MDEQGDGTIAPREMRDRLEATKNYTKQDFSMIISKQFFKINIKLSKISKK